MVPPAIRNGIQQKGRDMYPRQISNYAALMVMHRAPIESARTSAAASGLVNRPRRGERTFSVLQRLRAGRSTVEGNLERPFFT
jgi:hypothetical protein